MLKHGKIEVDVVWNYVDSAELRTLALDAVESMTETMAIGYIRNIAVAYLTRQDFVGNRKIQINRISVDLKE